MKKSKLLAPAFAFLALSTAAAVTGTVAWFTASRVVTINASAITAYNPEENLKVVLSNPTGATIGTAEGKESTAAAVNTFHLRDASVDVAAQKVYGSVLNADGDQVASFKEVTSNLAAGTYKKQDNSTVDLFYAAKYTAKFSLYAGASDKTYDLKFDNTRTTIADLSSASAKDQALAPGLRIGIYVSATKFVVIAPYKTGTDLSAGLTYVNGVTLSDQDTYAAANSFYKKDSTNTGGEYTLGTLQGTGTNEVEATVWTWFEGTDSAIQNENIEGLSTALSVGLSFKIAEQA